MISLDPIIVIGRQYGGGGRKIGRILAGRFGIPYYDKELLSEAAQRLGLSQDLFARADEHRPSPLRSLLSLSYGVSDSFGMGDFSRESIYNAQSMVIRQLAAEGGCVFVGRTADYVLRDNPAMVSLFFHASEEVRARNLVTRGETDSTEKAMETMRRADADRKSFYNYFTGREWGLASNYDLTLDPSILGAEETADLLETYIRRIMHHRSEEQMK